MTVKEPLVSNKINLHTIIHGFFHSGAGCVLIVAGQSHIQSRNWRDLLVRSLENRAERKIHFAATRILVECPLLQVYSPRLATTEGGQLSLV